DGRSRRGELAVGDEAEGREVGDVGAVEEAGAAGGRELLVPGVDEASMGGHDRGVALDGGDEGREPGAVDDHVLVEEDDERRLDEGKGAVVAAAVAVIAVEAMDADAR